MGGGLAPNPGAALSYRNRVPVERSKGRASQAGGGWWCPTPPPLPTGRAQGMRLAQNPSEYFPPHWPIRFDTLGGAAPMDVQFRHPIAPTRAAIDAPSAPPGPVRAVQATAARV